MGKNALCGFQDSILSSKMLYYITFVVRITILGRIAAEARVLLVS